ncbi:MAG: hypothetical protein J1E35_03885 [Lachnospiraceae bacterium]|nr:hypothetical protein [Lachnospiraceae bacterium]
MEKAILAESFTMILIGGWLILQCLDIIVREEMQTHLFCVFGKLLLITGLLVLHPQPFLTLLYFFAFYPKTERNGRCLWLLGVQVFLPTVGAFVCVLKGTPDKQLLTVFFVLLPALFFAAAEFGIQSLLFYNRTLYRQMEKTALNELKVKNLNREISVRSQAAEQNARFEERENISRNIHNVVGHTITSALVSLQAYEVLKETQPVQAEEKLTAASERMRLALEEIRRAVRVLDAETEEIDIRDFRSLLAKETEKFSTDTELRIFHNFSEEDGIKAHSEEVVKGGTQEFFIEKRTCEFLHSVLTECLNNGIRHGGASTFFAELTYDAAHIRLAVSDDGQGFAGLAPAEQQSRLEQGFGLRKIKDYAQRHGGTFGLLTENGFKVQVELPLTGNADRNGGNNDGSGISG